MAVSCQLLVQEGKRNRAVRQQSIMETPQRNAGTTPCSQIMDGGPTHEVGRGVRRIPMPYVSGDFALRHVPVERDLFLQEPDRFSQTHVPRMETGIYDHSNGAPEGITQLEEFDGRIVEQAGFFQQILRVETPTLGKEWRHEITANRRRLCRQLVMDSLEMMSGISLMACDRFTERIAVIAHVLGPAVGRSVRIDGGDQPITYQTGFEARAR